MLHRGAEDTGNCTVVTLGDIEKQRCAEIHRQHSGAGVGGGAVDAAGCRLQHRW